MPTRTVERTDTRHPTRLTDPAHPPHAFAVRDPYRRRTPPRSPPLSSDTPAEGLALLNLAPVMAAEAVLRSCCGSHRWARRMAAHRPYPTLDALLAAADEAAFDLTPGDLAEALAGEHTTALADRGNLAAHTALRAAHAAYEARFGHVFVIDLSTADPAEELDLTLVSLRERLGHDADEEVTATAEQLRGICRARLLRLAGEPYPPPPWAAGSPDRAGSLTPGPPRGPEPTARRYDGRGRWTVPGRA
ncbi:2-oxo-4-hydroxy-4-carboxy-5-ureidoimidazoline decarboxylase [Actinacidiphila sp. ITFR-21]|uniref:2-oxo-4-hydroxy-4-carboxy-5-ureidoimidazoline decarboxylase n=1 Tax=Actinacidiphila sp. ITFR-21 TaxID=3075199 RepID=UPI00288AD926|nr:2-oxo-4-hydroxy-4-carboxy-5-ureidoimidazoline decarboxylase [Streptomyces sp. ITFR-21]WNI17392.1 2-oxo-4-hydroxy-4-carboxy-5-ureidoimidazoline decarboxylase [Streptomyces sp. ITFR-21]